MLCQVVTHSCRFEQRSYMFAVNSGVHSVEHLCGMKAIAVYSCHRSIVVALMSFCRFISATCAVNIASAKSALLMPMIHCSSA